MTRRGKEKPPHDESRSTAWAVIACAEAKRPKAVVIENVPECRRWTLYWYIVGVYGGNR